MLVGLEGQEKEEIRVERQRRLEWCRVEQRP